MKQENAFLLFQNIFAITGNVEFLSLVICENKGKGSAGNGCVSDYRKILA